MESPNEQIYGSITAPALTRPNYSQSEAKPKRLDIEITRNCKYNCGICSVSAEYGVMELELTLDQIRNQISDFADLGGQELVITGGEPLERGLSFVCDVISHAKACNLLVKLYTVGYTIVDSSVASALKIAGLDIAYVSLEGTPESDERYKGVTGSYRIAVNAIRYLSAAGVEVIIHFTPISVNYGDIAHVMEAARFLRVKAVKIIAFVPQGRGFDNRNSYELTDAKRKEFGLTLASVIPQFPEIRVEFGGSPDYPPVAHPGCSIGTRGFSITNTGRIIPCLGLRSDLSTERFELGNIREKRLAEIWHAEFMNELRQARPKCGICQSSRRQVLNIKS